MPEVEKDEFEPTGFVHDSGPLPIEALEAISWINSKDAEIERLEKLVELAIRDSGDHPDGPMLSQEFWDLYGQNTDRTRSTG